MANTSYPKGMEKLLSGSINASTDTFKAALLPSGYAFSVSHEFVSQLGSIIGTAQPLLNKTITGGVLDADDLDFGALAPGSTIGSVVIFKDTGNTSTSPVLFFLDTVTGLPMATNGGAVTIPWDNGVKKIARINLPIYPKGAEKMWSGSINFSADNIRVALLPSAYVYDAAHEFLPDVGAVIGTAQALAGKSVAGGVFDAFSVNFGALPTGSTIGSVVLYKDTGTPATSPLIARVTDVLGLPLATNGGGLVLGWSGGTARIFSLVPA
ncbi:hypothetical protein F3K36_33695 [Delftia sp. BR1]|nr:hypothetical protein F3K36_33695 [Delftia sp. BR1]